MRSFRYPEAVASIFAIFWLVVLYLGADHPPPLGFLWLVPLVVTCAAVVRRRLPTYVAWLKQKKKWRVSRAALEGIAAGSAVGLITLAQQPSGKSGPIDVAIWLSVLCAVGMLNSLAVYALAAVFGRGSSAGANNSFKPTPLRGAA